jgi:hypothetical protein
MSDTALLLPAQDDSFLADSAARTRYLYRRISDTKVTIAKLKRQARRAAFDGLDIPYTAVSLLAAPSVSDSARDGVLARAKAGTKISVADVKTAIRMAKAETSR